MAIRRPPQKTRVGQNYWRYIQSPRLARTLFGNMKEQADYADSSLSETMAARIEIEELGDPVRQKKLTEAILALDGVIEAKIENDALHVSYDPLTTSEKKSSRLFAPPGILSKSRPQIQRLRIQTCQSRT
jgi:hypothetical protein